MRNIVGAVPLFVLLVALVGCQSLGPDGQSQNSSRCLRIYSATAWRVHQVIPGGILSRTQVYDKEDLSDQRKGTGLVVVADGRRFLVTASHVVVPQWADGVAAASKWQGQSSLTGGSVRIRASSLAYSPQRLYVDQASDIAILEMPAEFWEKLNVLAFVPKTELPRLEEAVKTWGFPKPAAPQLKVGAQVITANAEMLEFNEPLDGGFSGGPVLNTYDQLIGMVLRSTDRQSRAVPSAKILRAIADFESHAVSYRDPMEIPSAGSAFNTDPYLH
jgi:S1-C subfamily serine protease